MTLAQKINELPFYQASYEAEQLCSNVEHYPHGSIYLFNDGSRLGFYIKTNSTEVLSNS